MANSPRRVYWDACTWIALIQRERIRGPDGRVEDRGALCRVVLNQALAGDAEIATSSFSLVEVCKNPTLRNEKEDKIADFFENDYVLLVNLDKRVGILARRLMTAGLAKLKPADASHLASAAISAAEEMHTFDEDLLRLDGRVDKPDGTKLKICKPSPGGPPLPLLRVVENG
jgi:predicted nucleic acid-binding protein